VGADAVRGHRPGASPRGLRRWRRLPPLYDTTTDFSQARDLAAEQPHKLAELQAVFEKEAGRVGIQPLRDARVHRTPMPSHTAGRDHFVYQRGAVGIPETQGPMLRARSWTLRATIDVPGSGAHGVLASMGGQNAGLALYLTHDGRPEFVHRTFEVARLCLSSAEPLDAGGHVLEVEFE
jgi:arylsulfatase